MKKYIGLWITAIIILCIGISLAVAGVASGATKLISNAPKIVERAVEFIDTTLPKLNITSKGFTSTEAVNCVTLDLDGYNVALIPTNKEAKVSYPDNAEINVTTENGVMTVSGTNTVKSIATVKIYLPCVELKADVKNSFLNAEKINVASLDITAVNTVISIEESVVGIAVDVNTDNGAVSVENLKCKTGDINITSDTGIISIEESSASGISLTSNSGIVKFSSLYASTIGVSTVSSAIEGELEGMRSSYTVSITKGGVLTTKGNGSRTVNIFTDTGRVDIEYDD